MRWTGNGGSTTTWSGRGWENNYLCPKRNRSPVTQPGGNHRAHLNVVRWVLERLYRFMKSVLQPLLIHCVYSCVTGRQVNGRTNGKRTYVWMGWWKSKWLIDCMVQDLPSKVYSGGWKTFTNVMQPAGHTKSHHWISSVKIVATFSSRFILIYTSFFPVFPELYLLFRFSVQYVSTRCHMRATWLAQALDSICQSY